MAYVKIIFQNSPSTATPINAENLNHMDDQIALNDQRLSDLEGAHVSSFNGRTGAVTPADGDYDIGQITPLSGAQVGQVPVVTNIGTEEDPELVFRMGAGGGAGGHEILDADGTSMPQESAMQFPDSHVTDDEANGRTIVENIKAVTQAQYPSQTEDGTYLITDGEGAVIEPASDDVVTVEHDGTKTWRQLLNELFSEIDLSKVTDKTTLVGSDGSFFVLNYKSPTVVNFIHSEVQAYFVNATIQSSNSVYSTGTNGSVTDISGNIATIDFTLYYGNKKATVDLQTTANRCWMGDGQSVATAMGKRAESVVTELNIINSDTLNVNIPANVSKYGGYIDLMTYSTGVELNSYRIPFRGQSNGDVSIGKALSTASITVASASYSNDKLTIKFSSTVMLFGYAIAFKVS